MKNKDRLSLDFFYICFLNAVSFVLVFMIFKVFLDAFSCDYSVVLIKNN